MTPRQSQTCPDLGLGSSLMPAAVDRGLLVRFGLSGQLTPSISHTGSSSAHLTPGAGCMGSMPFTCLGYRLWTTTPRINDLIV
jgi:hypothetical protein